jgi:hypothetical protein
MQIETNQKTFGKATQRQIKKLAPAARTFKKVTDGYLIKDDQGKTLATWTPRKMATGLIVIW